MKKYDVILIGTGAANIIADAAQLAGSTALYIRIPQHPEKNRNPSWAGCSADG